ncbi:hypothetical protein OG339_14150 [Streptosporangium sp. NBC_01495]|uniref:HoxN/HupN/NixA family nickel/cobalt transporter n=1 Tax=Streptosporangium sp. NBC_01495 TaxID=2903899 RepID=UPI002E33541A|nr:hypothetical protein [Streptosporangium sp. NBC_01495]
METARDGRAVVTEFGGFESRFVALFDNRGVFWAILAVALVAGALHAVAPGHGKSVTAAYLVGTRGGYRDALRLGVIVALMHTFSVLVLAFAWVGLSGAASFGTKNVTAWMQVAAGLITIGVGAHLTYRHLRGWNRHRLQTHHGHGHGHGHGHSHGHGHGHGHGHQVEDGTDPWSRRGLLALALSGGLLPSPSAFVVLMSGLLTGRAFDAVVLVAAFGLGMALTLTGVGVVTIRGYALLARGTRRWSPASTALAWAPAAAGVAVSLAGGLYLAVAISVLTG